jgi:hypothetical protein
MTLPGDLRSLNELLVASSLLGRNAVAFGELDSSCDHKSSLNGGVAEILVEVVKHPLVHHVLIAHFLGTPCVRKDRVRRTRIIREERLEVQCIRIE